MNYREMNDAQMIAWGVQERQQRMVDLSGPKSAESLKAAQDRAEARRKLIGATRGQATDMVLMASRAARRAA